MLRLIEALKLEPTLVPSKPPLLPASSSPELVLFVGYPALGKSSFFRTHFAPASYVHINQDTLKTRDKCVKAAEEALKEKKSAVNGEALLSRTVFANAQTRCRQHQPRRGHSQEIHPHCTEVQDPYKVS